MTWHAASIGLLGWRALSQSLVGRCVPGPLCPLLGSSYPAAAQLGRRGEHLTHTPPAHLPSSESPWPQETPTLLLLAGVQCALPVSLCTQPPEAALACPQPPEFSQGVQPPVSMFRLPQAPGTQEALSRALPSRFRLLSAAQGPWPWCEPPASPSHGSSHLWQEVPGAPLLSCDPGEHPCTEGKEKIQSTRYFYRSPSAPGHA